MRLTKQQYYDELIKACTDGRFPSYETVEGRCLYRGEGGRACAVGILIPDEEYDAGMEGHTVETLDTDLLEDICPEEMTFDDLSRVQRAHDETAFEKVRGHTFANRFLNRVNSLACFADVARINAREMKSRYYERNPQAVTTTPKED